MIGESNQNVFLIQIDASNLAEFEISEFEISRFDCISANKIVFIARKISAIDVMIVKKCRPGLDAASETRSSDAEAGLGLHFLHMSKVPFSHDAGHMLYKIK